MELVIAIVANVVLGLVLAGLHMRAQKDQPTRLAGVQEALGIYRRLFPDATGIVAVSDDGQTALITLQQEPLIGLVSRHGRRWNARKVAPGDLMSVALIATDTIRLALTDFGWPRTDFRIQDHQARTEWLSRLALLRSNR